MTARGRLFFFKRSAHLLLHCRNVVQLGAFSVEIRPRVSTSLKQLFTLCRHLFQFEGKVAFAFVF